MKSNLDKYVQQVISGFQLNRGRASVYCFPPISFAELVLNVLNQFYEKAAGVPVFIAVDCYATRKAIIDRLAKENPSKYNVKILSADYIKSAYKYDYRLIITVGINDNVDFIKFMSEQGKFVLTILTKNIMDPNFINKVRELLPPIEVTVSNNSVRADSIYSPVEEYRLGVVLDKEDQELYDKCTQYITTSVSIFGDIKNIEKCKIGDTQLNISGAEYREMVAKENGWSTTLDTSVEWSKQIDDIYNPNMLWERANNFYNITKQRRDLITDNVAKLVEIWKICNEHQGKRILIVSKRGEFAASITKYINEVGEFECADFHDTIENKPAIDIYGVPILIKSGADKGKPKIIGAQAISTANMKAFNDNAVKILSIKSSSNIKLEIAVDMIIYTTPIIDGIIELKTRFSNVKFEGATTILYKVYCKGTIEHKNLLNQKESSLITIIDNEDENNIGFEEINTGEIW